MSVEFINLLVLFFVIIDPIKSFIYFFVKTNTLTKLERRKIAFLSIGIAIALLYVFLFFGAQVLEVLRINLNVFRIAGGILLGLSGAAMCGVYLSRLSSESKKGEAEDENLTTAIVIATPLLTGPAAITTVIISVIDHGMLMTGLTATLIFILTLILFLSSTFFTKIFNRSKVTLRVISTILGLITFANGIKFIMIGLHVIS
jgi:multiple antibiotic resistance protein